MRPNAFHVAKAATRPVNAASRLSHSNTVVFSLGGWSLLSMRGSANPVKVSLYPGYENFIVLVMRAGLPPALSPNTWPWVAMVPHKNGNSAARRAGGVSRQKSRRSDAVSDTPLALFISEASAPVNTSCHRTPSAITSITYCVLSAAGGRIVLCASSVVMPARHHAIAATAA